MQDQASAATTRSLSSTQVLKQLSTQQRRRWGRSLHRSRRAVATALARRHLAYPILGTAVSERLSEDEYARRYLVPLLYTLERALSSGAPHFLDIYRAQRTRFYSRALLAAGGQRELEAVLDDDRQVLSDLVARGSGLSRFLEAVDRPLYAGQLERSIRVGLVGDCVMGEIASFLAPLLLGSGTRLEGHQFYFSSRNGAHLDAEEVKEGLKEHDFDLLAMSFLTLEGLPLYTALIRESQHLSTLTKSAAAQCDALLTLIDRFVAEVREITDRPILLHGCSGLPLTKVRRYLPVVPAMARGHQLVARRLDEGLRAIAEGVENVVFIDEVAALESIGARAANRRLVPRLMRSVFHPSSFGRAVAPQYSRVVRAYAALSKTKVVLVDFDHTLWQGVMADGEVVHDREGQQLLRSLEAAGILLVAVSKNDPANIRWDEMVLEESYFILRKIGWGTKLQSVLEVAQQLDLDPRSFVLLDDNPAERELVVTGAPGVTALDPLEAESWDFLRLLLDFPATRQTEEAGRRTAMYAEAAERRALQNASVDYDTMMHSLELRTRWRKARPADLDRISELVNRTNQFNTTTTRSSKAELAELVASADHAIYIASLADKFGDLGVVGASVVSWSGAELRFENVVMSCRAMGFGLEAQLVRGVLDDRRGATVAVGRYVPTDRNNPCAGLFSSLGFVRDGEHDWRLALGGELPAVPRWLNVEDGERSHRAPSRHVELVGRA